MLHLLPLCFFYFDGCGDTVRYNSSTLVTLLREIAKCKSSKLDWALLAKCTATGITSAREYQAVWRSIAYRAELLNAFEDNDQALVSFKVFEGFRVLWSGRVKCCPASVATLLKSLVCDFFSYLSKLME